MMLTHTADLRENIGGCSICHQKIINTNANCSNLVATQMGFETGEDRLANCNGRIINATVVNMKNSNEAKEIHSFWI